MVPDSKITRALAKLRISLFWSFAKIFACLSMKHVTTTSYHHQANKEVDRSNKKIVARLEVYVVELHTD